MRKILLVEDDSSLGQNLRDRLAQDYAVTWCRSVQETERLLPEGGWDLAILDVGLPDGDGFQIAQKITRQEGCRFLFLTAQSDADSRLKGFELGADEYIPKPFYLKELLLRVKHVLDSHPIRKEIVLGEQILNLSDFSVRKPNGSIEYPPVTDMKILKILIERSPRVLTRDEILDEVWGQDHENNTRTVDNAVVRLRQLLQKEGERIRSVRGIGYQWIGDQEHE